MDGGRINLEFAAMLMSPQACLMYPLLETDDTRRSANIEAGYYCVADLNYTIEMRALDKARAAAQPGGHRDESDDNTLAALAGLLPVAGCVIRLTQTPCMPHDRGTFGRPVPVKPFCIVRVLQTSSQSWCRFSIWCRIRSSSSGCTEAGRKITTGRSAVCGAAGVHQPRA